MYDWLKDWPALALTCGLPLSRQGCPRIPSPSQQCKRLRAAGAPLFESLFVLTVLLALHRQLIGARDLIIDSAPILARSCEAIASIPCSGLPLLFLLSPANLHDAPFARPLLQWAVHLYHLRPRIIRLDAAYWGLQLIRWIHAVLGAVAVVPCHPKRAARTVPAFLPPTCTKEELGKRTAIERFFGRVFLFFRLQCPPLSGWSAIAIRVALTYTASIVIGLAAQQSRTSRPDPLS